MYIFSLLWSLILSTLSLFLFLYDLSFSLPFLSFSLSLRLPLSHIKFRVDFGNQCDWVMVVQHILCLTSVLSSAPCLYSTSHHRLAHQEILFFFFFFCSKSTLVWRPACRSYSRIDSVRKFFLQFGFGSMLGLGFLLCVNHRCGLR